MLGLNGDERLQNQLEAVMPFALSMIVDNQKGGMALAFELALEDLGPMKKNVEEQHWRHDWEVEVEESQSSWD